VKKIIIYIIIAAAVLLAFNLTWQNGHTSGWQFFNEHMKKDLEQTHVPEELYNEVSERLWQCQQQQQPPHLRQERWQWQNWQSERQEMELQQRLNAQHLKNLQQQHLKDPQQDGKPAGR